MKISLDLQPLMRRFEMVLSAIDDYFEPKEESEKRLLYVMPALLLFLLSYLFLFPAAESWVREKQSELGRVKESLEKNRFFVQTLERSGGVEPRRAELEKTRERLESSELLSKRAEATLGEVYAMSQAWYFTLDFATKEASELGLEIIDSSFGSFEGLGAGGLEKSWMRLRGKGAKRAFLEYLYRLERQGKFVSLERIYLEPKGERLEFEVVIGNQKGSL